MKFIWPICINVYNISLEVDMKYILNSYEIDMKYIWHAPDTKLSVPKAANTLIRTSWFSFQLIWCTFKFHTYIPSKEFFYEIHVNEYWVHHTITSHLEFCACPEQSDFMVIHTYDQHAQRLHWSTALSDLGISHCTWEAQMNFHEVIIHLYCVTVTKMFYNLY